jgi:hypothetical protein
LTDPGFCSTLVKVKRNSRKQERTECSGLVRTCWETGRGEIRYALAKFVDISRYGMGIQLTEEIPARTFVTVRSEELKISGTGISRYCIRRGGKYIVGLEFSGGLDGVRSSAPVAAAASGD